MQDRPDARELIEAVATFLENEIIPATTDARLRFRALIAANVLAVVGRELEAGDAPLLRERARLEKLLGHAERVDDELCGDALHSEARELSRTLCREIRRGAFDSDTAFGEAFAHARATVIDKLHVTNPRYLERFIATGNG